MPGRHRQISEWSERRKQWRQIHLINHVLDLSNVEAGKMSLEIATVALDGFIPQTVEQMKGQVGERPIELRAEVPAGLAPIETDAGKLKQVIINLIGNALKFTEQGSVTVRVTADAAGRPVRIDVMEKKETPFQRCFRTWKPPFWR